ncbi:MAG: MoaD/ThiS family protein [Pirellulales bacterium]
MQCKVKLFAVAKQLVGADACTVNVAEPATIAMLKAALAEQVPALAGLVTGVRFAVNADFARDDTPLDVQSEIALIPPVSGG